MFCPSDSIDSEDSYRERESTNISDHGLAQPTHCEFVRIWREWVSIAELMFYSTSPAEEGREVEKKEEKKALFIGGPFIPRKKKNGGKEKLWYAGNVP